VREEHEIDLEHRAWIIPAERMKAGNAHRVPLNDVALNIVEAMKARKHPHCSTYFPVRVAAC
jgi:integrase